MCNDTIESIIAEMREFADTESQSIGRDVLRREIQYFAERIEATHKLELEDCVLRVAPIVRAETKAECQREVAHERENALNTKLPENVNSERVIYNNANCREALEKFVQAYGHEKCVHTTLLAEAYEDAKVALSAPPRNCDRFSNIREASIAFNNECPVDRDNIRTMTFNEWLFAEAKGEAK